ncbi:MAG: hypothetical protein DWQ44_06795 [Bacteroidetes bacterium]|nr:MAG: hypothetical protein DWQ39_04380 [Bacteroidota bacterium]REK34605.1 MAG: hypothetical protein DWQ44_06795 [Bacteroidota bacterium]
MKLLFDQNISLRIISKINSEFPDSRQVRELGLENFNDNQIGQYTKENSFTIVTFDSDFSDISNLKGHPP